ncbi:MAG: ABC transporter substrate-binding protein [Proteobacteria bacterium]|nr:ABC transporter substrate-binding protein [Pseudomonadota bacterium]
MRKTIAVIALGAVALTMSVPARAEVSELRVPLGAGGFGFLPLHMMKKYQLVEKEAEKLGLKLTVNYAKIGGPSVMNDALLSGSADFISAGPPSFLILWDRTKGKGDVRGVAAMSTMPMYLNTSEPHLKTLDDIKTGDKIAVTAVKVSIPAIIMQMYAKQKDGADKTFKFDPFTVSMTHPDGVVAMLSGNKQITAHYTSPPFAQRELEDGKIRTIQTTNDVMGGPQTFTMISTTTKFHDNNPKAYAAFVAALKQAFAMIKRDKKAAAEVLLESMGGKGWTTDQLIKILDQPDIYYTTKPEGVMKYAEFMNSIGTLKHKPASLDELFFDAKSLGGGN